MTERDTLPRDTLLRFEMRGIRKAFGATLALDGVELGVAAGEVCALVGQNGAGKSTLMGILSGALQPDAGSMTLDGSPYRPHSPLEARRAGVAMIYQELSLAPDLSVMENIVLGMEPTQLGLLHWKRVRQTAREVLAQLEHPEIAPEAVVGRLSAGSQQLVEIARALAIGCRVLVLDEPTSSLGREDVRRLFELVGRLKAQGHAVVYISHFIEEVKQVAERFVVLRDGRNAGAGSTAAASHEQIVSLMVGRKVEDLYPRTARVSGEPILEVDGLGPGSAAFTLHRGEVFGIAGLVGAGRTELLRALFGLEPVHSGRVRLGAYSGFHPPSERWRQGMGFVSEDRKEEGLALGLSVADNMTLSRLSGLGPGPLVLPSRQAQASERWVDELGVRCASPQQTVASLSGGNQQKVAIARLLHHDVDVLLLDEPTRGIDVGSKAQIYALVDALVSAKVAPQQDLQQRAASAAGFTPAEGGLGGAAQHPPAQQAAKAVLMVSSYFPELLGLCDRIAVMCRGRLGPARPAAELDEHRLIMEATGAGGA